MAAITRFEEILAWQKAKELVREVYLVFVRIDLLLGTPHTELRTRNVFGHFQRSSCESA